MACRLSPFRSSTRGGLGHRWLAGDARPAHAVAAMPPALGASSSAGYPAGRGAGAGAPASRARQ